MSSKVQVSVGFSAWRRCEGADFIDQCTSCMRVIDALAVVLLCARRRGVPRQRLDGLGDHEAWETARATASVTPRGGQNVRVPLRFAAFSPWRPKPYPVLWLAIDAALDMSLGPSMKWTCAVDPVLWRGSAPCFSSRHDRMERWLFAEARKKRPRKMFRPGNMCQRSM